jgi:Uma2 family endonuclease
VANYWLLDAFARTLECLRLEDGSYAREVRGEGDQMIEPGMFPGLVIELGEIWL